ncbi:MAG: hypothetical protein K2N80_08895 [Lachnospiraceae bacterium]|nr:hypothetical protein [Lachnospiraceae bacterium]
MRFIGKDQEKIKAAAKLHVQEVKKYIARSSEEKQKDIYRAVITLLADNSRENDFDKYKWLETFLLADVEKLREMKEREGIDRKYFVELYENWFSRRESSYNALFLVKALGLKVCPYCDRNYINVVYRDMDKAERRTDQLDHFFPKGKYPMLAMCFYNLIPVCASCNLLKRESEISMNPYEDGIEEQLYFDACFSASNSQSGWDEENVCLHMYYTPKMRNNVEVLALNREYELHKDTVYEILTKAAFYDKEKKEELCRNYPLLFPNLKSVKRILYGMDFQKSSNRPLQKLYQDILRVYEQEENGL